MLMTVRHDGAEGSPYGHLKQPCCARDGGWG
jgi:hypothetical protein